MSLQLIIGRAGSGKTTYCYEALEKKLAQGIDEALIMLVPEQYNLQTQQALAYRIYPGLLKVEVQSFNNLARRVFGELGGPQEPIVDDLGRLMILRKMIEEHQNQLVLFKKSGRQAGFMECLNRLITEFEQYRISPQVLGDLYHQAKDSPALQHKLHDIQVIYTGFMDYIESKFLTNEQTIDRLISKVKESNYIKGAHIWMNGFYGFSPQQYELIVELLKQAAQVTITLPLETAPRISDILNENDPFYERKKAFQKLTSNALENGIEVLDPVILENPRLEDASGKCLELCHLEREYLKHQPKVYQEESKDLWIHEFTNQYEEIQALAKEIISLVRDQGYRYQDIAVVAGDLAAYEGIIKGIFESYEIPTFIDEKKSISTHVLVELIKGSLDVINMNWSYKAVMRVLRTGLYPIQTEEMDLLENYLLAFGIRGKKVWLGQDPWDYEEVDYLSDEAKAYVLERQKQVDDIRRRVAGHLNALQEKMRPKKARPTIKEMSIALYEFLETIQAQETIAKWIDEAKEAQDLSLEKEHSQIGDQVKEILERLVDILGDEKVTTGLYSKILESAFNTSKMGMIPPARDQVIVGDIERSRIHGVEILFIIGTNDGLIPRVDDGPEIFSDMDRMKIEQTHVEIMASSRQQTFESQFLVYLAITKPRKRLVISCALADEAGKSMRPSIVLHRLRRIFPKTKAVTDRGLLDNIHHPNPAFGYVGRKMRETLDGIIKTDEQGEEWKDVASWYMTQEGWKDKVETAISYLFYTNQQHYLDKETAKMLYQSPLHASVSKLETFRQCAFSYFIKYGIRAEERKLFEFNAMDLGILFHKALEGYPQRLEKDNLSWRDVSQEVMDTYVGEVVEEVVAQYGGSIRRPTAQNKYRVRQVKSMTKRAVKILTNQLKQGEFNPKEYEVAFGDGELPPIMINIDGDRKMLLTGTIDRVDVYQQENQEFIKILDYKSGKKSFDLLEIYYGLQLQLLLYLDAYLKINPNYLPAGMFYFHIDNPLIEYTKNMSQEDIETERAKRFRLSGMLLESLDIAKALEKDVEGNIIPATLKKNGDFKASSSVASEEEFDVLRNHIIEVIRELGKEILNGKVSALPYQLDKHQPCDYCDYRSICQFDVSQQDNEYEALEKLSKKEIWKRLEKERKEAGHVDTRTEGSH